jgi:putative FmdB family regulatory protein
VPIYAYRCSACGHAQDVLQKISDPRLTVCPACGQPTLVKQVTAAGFQLKGSGWYVTDFRNPAGAAKPAAEGASSDTSSDKAGSTAGDAPAAAPAPEAKGTDAGTSPSAAPTSSPAPKPAPSASPSSSSTG